MKLDGYIIVGKYQNCNIPRQFLPLYIKLKNDNMVLIELSSNLNSRPLGNNAKARAKNARKLLKLVTSWLENFEVLSISRYK